MKKLPAILAALIVFTGCTPGKALFTLKTSELRKALSGQPAHISVVMTSATELTNAYAKVTFGGGRFTNQLDVLRRSMNGQEGEFVALDDFVRGDRSKDPVAGDRTRMWIEESEGKLPVFKSETHLEILLGTKSVLESLRGTTNSTELCVMEMDAKEGTIRDNQDERDFNARIHALSAWCRGSIGMFELICGDGKHWDGGKRWDCEMRWNMMMVSGTVWESLFPAYYKNLSVEIVGDGTPIYVIAEDVTIDGKKLKKYEGYVKEGDRLVMELDKEAHGWDGGVRFLLDKPAK